MNSWRKFLASSHIEPRTFLLQEDWISVNADTAEGFEPVMELHAAEGPVRSLTILRGQPASNDRGGGGGGETPDQRRRQIQVL